MQVIDPNAGKLEGLFVLGYGDSGTGKTEIAGTLGELGPTLIVDVDQGYETLVKTKGSRLTQKMRDNISIVSFDAFKDLNSLYRLVEKNDPDSWKKTIPALLATEPFKWIVWDTWSELQWFMLQELRKNEAKKDSDMITANMGKDIDFRKNIGIQHWGMLTDLNKLAVEQLRTVSKNRVCNQLFLMQEKTATDQQGNITGKGPAIHGKMMQEMPPFFDIVFHTYTSPTGEFFVSTKRKNGWPAKTRVGEGKEYKSPTAKEIFTGL